ncbi:hypothetical protein ABPG72_015971 [Tetrahymena utriculariae]
MEKFKIDNKIGYQNMKSLFVEKQQAYSSKDRVYPGRFRLKFLEDSVFDLRFTLKYNTKQKIEEVNQISDDNQKKDLSDQKLLYIQEEFIKCLKQLINYYWQNAIDSCKLKDSAAKSEIN